MDQRGRAFESRRAFMDVLLLKLADHVTPSQDLLDRWKTKIEKLMKEVKTNLSDKYVIDRGTMGGSMAKKTAVLQPDCDCILFLDKLPATQSKKFMKDVDKALLKTSFFINNVQIRRYIIQFDVDGEIHVDFLFAHNYLPASHGTELTTEMLAKQRAAILEHLSKKSEKDRNSSFSYFTSLAESQVQFMRSQSLFILNLVKLLRFWYKTLSSEDVYKIPGLKYIIEIVAVYCGQLEEDEAVQNQRAPSIVHGLEKAFIMLSKEENMKVVFDNDKYVSPNHINDIIRGHSTLQSQPAVPKTILNRGSFIVDPVNPFNDILERMKDYEMKKRPILLTDVIETLEWQSKESLSILQKCLAGEEIKWGAVPDYELAWIPTLFGTSNFLGEESSTMHEYAVAFTYFENYDDFMKEMTGYGWTGRYSTEYIDGIRNDFNSCVSLASFQLLDKTFSSPKKFKKYLETFQKLLIETMYGRWPLVVNRQKYIGDSKEENALTVLHHSFDEEGGPAFLAKVMTLEEHYGISFGGVFHKPMKFAGPCIVPGKDYGKQVYYACCMLLFINVPMWTPNFNFEEWYNS